MCFTVKLSRVANSKSVIVGCLLTLVSCAHPVVSPPMIQAVEQGEIDPFRIVFICQGMLKDLGSRWDMKLQKELCDKDQLGIAIRYWSDPTGVWFNWGCIAPGKLIAELIDEISLAHRRIAPDQELEFHAIGFSNGCEAIIEAAERICYGTLKRVAFVHSSSFFLSNEVGNLIEEGKIEDVINYWSPMDGTTILAPLGAGEFGLQTGGDRVDNRMTCMPHMAFFIDQDFRTELMHDVLGSDHPYETSKTAFGQELATILRSYVDDEP